MHIEQLRLSSFVRPSVCSGDAIFPIFLREDILGLRRVVRRVLRRAVCRGVLRVLCRVVCLRRLVCLRELLEFARCRVFRRRVLCVLRLPLFRLSPLVANDA